MGRRLQGPRGIRPRAPSVSRAPGWRPARPLGSQLSPTAGGRCGPQSGESSSPQVLDRFPAIAGCVWTWDRCRHWKPNRRRRRGRWYPTRPSGFRHCPRSATCARRLDSSSRSCPSRAQAAPAGRSPGPVPTTAALTDSHRCAARPQRCRTRRAVRTVRPFVLLAESFSRRHDPAIASDSAKNDFPVPVAPLSKHTWPSRSSGRL